MRTGQSLPNLGAHGAPYDHEAGARLHRLVARIFAGVSSRLAGADLRLLPLVDDLYIKVHYGLISTIQRRAIMYQHLPNRFHSSSGLRRLPFLLPRQ